MRVQLVKGNTNYRYFNGDADNNSGQFEDYSNDIVMITGQVQRKIWRRIYAGFYGEYNNTKTYFKAHGDSLDEQNLSNIGVCDQQ